MRRFNILAGLAMLAAHPAAAAFIIHLYSPWAADPARPSPPAFIMIQGKEPGYYPGTAVKADGGDWFSYVFAGDAPGAKDGFKFVDYLPTGGNQYSAGLTFDNGGKDFTMGDVFLTPGVKEAWIIPQGAGKAPVVTAIPPKSKVAYLFNPWPETAPDIRLAGDTAALPMRPAADPARCGWYVHYFATAARAASFRSRVGRETYGRAGLGDTASLDLAAAFASSDTVFILPQPLPGGPPSLSPTFPTGGTAGTCSFPLAVTIRDFSAQHPDFEKDGMEGQLHKGMVAPTLPPDKKPRQGPVSFFQSHFDQWFRTDSTDTDPKLRNYETCRDLSFSKDPAGYWGHDSYNDPDHGFFPIDDFNRFNETYQSHYRDAATGKWVDGTLHNFHFCMEMHASFRYRQGQVFRFSGDDDVWVYIDNRLAIDIGGTHGPEADSVSVDTMRLTPGNKYDFDLYYCERKTKGSNLFIQTSIYFEQSQAVWARRTLDGTRERYDIFEILSGDKSCGAAPDGDTVAAHSAFRLSGPGIDPPKSLPAGISYGGIDIDPGRTQVTIDTAKMTGLAPGAYEIRFASDRSGQGGTIRFIISQPPVPVIPPVPIKALRAWAFDRDGDGRIDGATAVFDSMLPALPARLDFAFADAFGHTGNVSATGPAIGPVPGMPDRVTVTFALPLPFGLTSFEPAATGRTFAQTAGPLIDASFPVADSVAPVLVAAAVREPDSAQPLKRILVTLSENAPMPAGAAPLIFSRDGAPLPAGAVRISRSERVGDRQWAFYLDPASEPMPIAGDSAALAIDGSVRDVQGNAPAHAFFRKLEGELPARAPLDLYVTFPDGSRDAPRPPPGSASPSVLPASAPAFIAVSREGFPLPGPGRCGGCAVVRDGVFAGPVFNLQVPGPSTYSFRIFTNTGVFVGSGTGRIEAADLAALEKGAGAGGARYKARIVWSGRAQDGSEAGTGAYILLADAVSDRDPRSGAPAEADRWKIRFGLLRP